MPARRPRLASSAATQALRASRELATLARAMRQARSPTAGLQLALKVPVIRQQRRTIRASRDGSSSLLRSEAAAFGQLFGSALFGGDGLLTDSGDGSSQALGRFYDSQSRIASSLIDRLVLGQRVR